MSNELASDLQLLKKYCIDQPQGESLRYFLGYANCGPFLKADVATVSIVQRDSVSTRCLFWPSTPRSPHQSTTRPTLQERYVFFDVVAPREVCVALECEYLEGEPSFSIRAACSLAGGRSTPPQYSIFASLVCDRNRRQGAASSSISRASSEEVLLRVHHVLDLFRMMSSELQDHGAAHFKALRKHLTAPVPVAFNALDFPLVVFDVLKSLYSSTTLVQGHAIPQNLPAYSRILETVTNSFFSRWRSDSEVPELIPHPSLLRRRPIVSVGFVPFHWWQYA